MCFGFGPRAHKNTAWCSQLLFCKASFRRDLLNWTVALTLFTVNLLCVPGGQGCVSFFEQLCQLSAWPEGCGHGSQEHRRGQQEAADWNCELAPVTIIIGRFFFPKNSYMAQKTYEIVTLKLPGRCSSLYVSSFFYSPLCPLFRSLQPPSPFRRRRVIWTKRLQT